MKQVSGVTKQQNKEIKNRKEKKESHSIAKQGLPGLHQSVLECSKGEFFYAGSYKELNCQIV